MTRWLPWLASAALVAVGGGAVYVSTIGLGGAQAATVDYLTQAAEQTDVTVTSAATGSVAAAASYTLAFGATPSLDGTVDSSASWTVDEVLVGLGEHVSAGQTLAVADAAELRTEQADLQLSQRQAELTLADAEAELAEAPGRTAAELAGLRVTIKALKAQLADAQDARDATTAGTTARAQAKVTVTTLKSQLQDARDQRTELKAERRAGYPSLVLAVSVAQQGVADLEAQLAELEAQLALATIVAPVDGIVAELDISAGYPAPAGTAAIVVDSDTLEVVAAVVESDISALAIGQSATVSIDAVEQDVPGVVSAVVPTTTGTTSSVVSYPVTVTLSDPDASILSGMSSEVEIVIDEATDVVAVPVTALSGRAGSYTVQVVGDDGAVEVRDVTVGLVTETLAEIRSGLAAGEEVVVGTASDRTQSDDEDQGQDAFAGLTGADMGGEPPAGGPPGEFGG